LVVATTITTWKQELFMNSGKFDVVIVRHGGSEGEEESTQRIYCRNKANDYGWATKLEEREQIRNEIAKALKDWEPANIKE
jgi:hypothetical protein